MKEFKSLANLHVLSRTSVFLIAIAHTLYCAVFYFFDITALFWFKLVEALASWSFYFGTRKLSAHQNFIIYFSRLSLFFSCSVCNIYLGTHFGFTAIMLLIIATGYMHNFRSEKMPILTAGLEVLIVIAVSAVAYFSPQHPASAFAQSFLHLMGISLCAFSTIVYAHLADLLSDHDKLDIQTREQSIRQDSESDRLSKLYNRAAMKEIMRSQLEIFSAEQNNIFCAALIDVDRIRTINEKYGHRFGDLAISNISQLIRRACEPHEGLIYASRWSGQEFLISAIASSEEEFLLLIEGIIASCERLTHSDGYHSARASLSAGVCISQRAIELDDLLHKIDTALYTAKERGGARANVVRLSSK